jgi:phosphoglycerate dehydrogenase-like enzyme
MTRLFVADPGIRQGQLEALRAQLPKGWHLSDSPEGAALILTEDATLDSSMIAKAGAALKLVVRLDTGKASLPELDVPLLEPPNTALVGVAEHAVALMLALRRRLAWVHAKTRAQAWAPDKVTPILTDQTKYTYNWIGLDDFGTLYRQTVGLVGLGYIGRAVAARLRPFGVKLLYTQRNRLSRDEEERLGVDYRDLDELLSEADIVSLHHRFQDGPGGNDKQFGAAAFARMKPHALFINTARGRLVDEEALVAALREGRIGGAGLDVFTYEPLPPGHPLLTLDDERLLLTPHVGGAPIQEAWENIARDIVEALQARLQDGEDA